MVDYLGWAATAVFVASYFFTRAESLRRTQMLGALMWVGYGVFLKAPPIVAANVLVLCAAAWTARRPAAMAAVEAPVPPSSGSSPGHAGSAGRS